jgi:hypothetical protein
MALWLHWWNAIVLLRPAFSRLRTFLWFATAVAGLTVRTDLLGVTSIVRTLSLKPVLYDRLLDHFHSAAIKPDALVALWARLVLKLFPAPVRVNGRLVLVSEPIWPTFQNRTHVQTGGEPDRHSGVSLLDAKDETAAAAKRQSVHAS